LGGASGDKKEGSFLRERKDPNASSPKRGKRDPEGSKGKGAALFFVFLKKFGILFLEKDKGLLSGRTE